MSEQRRQELEQRAMEFVLEAHYSEKAPVNPLERVKEALRTNTKENDMDVVMERPEVTRLPRLGRSWKIGLSAAAMIVAALVVSVKFMPAGGNGSGSHAFGVAESEGSGDHADLNAREEILKEHPVLSRQTGPDFSFASFYPEKYPSTKASVPQYQLPLKTEDIANSDQGMVQRFLSNPQAAALLKENGFAVMSGFDDNNFKEVYERLADKGLPIIVTPDTVLHLFHICFDEALKDLEEEVLAWDMLDVTKTLLDEQTRLYEFEEVVLREKWPVEYERGYKLREEALRMNIAYLSVAYKLLAGDGSAVEVHDDVADMVSAELQLVNAQGGFSESPIFGYKEDYSQYLPRGHYTRSDLLKRYFKAMLWFGRMAFLYNEIPERGEISASPPVTRDMADRMTIAASMLARDIADLPLVNAVARPESAMVLSEGEKATVMQLWSRVYSATSFFVGAADDLTPGEYKTLLNGEEPTSVLMDTKGLRSFQAGLEALPLPRIYGGTAGLRGNMAYGSASYRKGLEYTKGFRLMGQRYVPDSEAMARLVCPTLGAPLKGDAGATSDSLTYVESELGPIRGFPRGLDVMAVMGSTRAREILTDLRDDGYKGYKESFEVLQGQFARLSEADWNQNLYYGWLYALQPLLRDSTAYEGYPTFMQTRAYEERNLTTALASWAQLRHDTILYVKQSHTFNAESMKARVVGLVEPLPELYDRINRLCVMMSAGLTQQGMLSKSTGKRLERLAELSERLRQISVRELKGEELDKDDYLFIKNFAGAVENVLHSQSGKVSEQALRTDIIADVHTDQNSGQALEVGTGKIRLMAAAYYNPEGELIVGFGPVLSFYEFRHPAGDRLTDEKWQEMLVSPDTTPYDPEWVENFTAESVK